MTDLNVPSKRLQSLDAFRGLTMFLLMAEASLLYYALWDLFPEGSLLHHFFMQFEHHPWHGLRFWDLIQPFFMFIVGVSMAYSVRGREIRGQSRQQITRHILVRSGILLLLGTGLHCGYSQKLVWELWNVLTQLAFTTLIAYSIFRLSIPRQLVISIVILIAYDLLFRLWPVTGFDQPFVMDHNFGTWMDQLLMGKINPGGGWVAINFLSTSAHTIWGVLVGKVLQGDHSDNRKLQLLVTAGAVCLILGYGLDLLNITPVIKRICTSSFVLATGGYCLITLAGFYWLTDIKGYSRWTWWFVLVGMNPIFIYIFGQTVGLQWFNGFVGIFTNGFFQILGLSPKIQHLLTACTVLYLEWLMCRGLYNRRIFIKI